MISSSLEKALNEQIVCEIYSANLYLSMSFYFEKEGFNGFSTWMKKQSAEEMDHAYQMANFIIKRGGTAEVNTIDAVKKTWTSPLNAFEDAYAHECKISARINELLSQAQKEGDNATQDFSCNKTNWCMLMVACASFSFQPCRITICTQP